MKRAIIATLTGVAAVVGVVGASAPSASAHPLGNFTINQYSGLRITSDAVLIDLVTDMAEIPTFQLRDEIDRNGDGSFDGPESARWRDEQCRSQAAAVRLEVDEHQVEPATTGTSTLTFPPGQGGLTTLRLECSFRAALPSTASSRSLTYQNTNFAGRLGWREIVAVGDGATLTASDVPDTDITNRLTQYPKDQLSSPLDQRSASVRFVTTASASPTANAPAPAVTPPLPRGADRLTRAFTDLVAKQRLSVAFGLVAFGIALLLGAFHALAPGHGKTVMAAYIVSERGTWRQAALIGLAVTVTHTAGVVALGVLLTTSSVVAPERLYPWFGLVSGLLLAGIGVTLARRAWRARRGAPRPGPERSTATVAAMAVASPVDELVLVGAAVGGSSLSTHDHGPHSVGEHHHDHDHSHDGRGHTHDHDHSHGHDRAHEPHSALEASGAHYHGGRLHTHAPIDPSLGWKSLLAVGFAGGLVPNPSALVVLLGAIALGRPWFGLLLVTAYGVGMAATLTGAGLLLVRARGLIDRRSWGTPTGQVMRVTRFLPLVTSTIIIAAGCLVAAGAIGRL